MYLIYYDDSLKIEKLRQYADNKYFRAEFNSPVTVYTEDEVFNDFFHNIFYDCIPYLFSKNVEKGVPKLIGHLIAEEEKQIKICNSRIEAYGESFKEFYFGGNKNGSSS